MCVSFVRNAGVCIFFVRFFYLILCFLLWVFLGMNWTFVYNMYFMCILCVFVLEFVFIFDIMCVFLSFMYIAMKKFEVSNVLWHVNQFDVLCNDANYFYSYSSLICTIDWKKRTITFYSDWDYSKTTRKHLYAFLCDYGFNLNCKNDVQKTILDGYVCRYWIDYKVTLW